MVEDALVTTKTYADTVCCACGVFSAVREHEFERGVPVDKGWCAICRDNVDFIYTADDDETP